jgi:hypothetical protein
MIIALMIRPLDLAKFRLQLTITFKFSQSFKAFFSKNVFDLVTGRRILYISPKK